MGVGGGVSIIDVVAAGGEETGGEETGGGFSPGHVPKAIQALSRLSTPFLPEGDGTAEQTMANPAAALIR